MNPGRTVFAQPLQHFPRYEFDNRVRRYDGITGFDGSLAMTSCCAWPLRR